MKVIRIAKTGEDALTATDPNDFVFATDWNTPKIVKEAFHSPTLSTNISEDFTSVAHGLNYTPFAIPFCQFEDNRVGLAGTKASGVDFFFTNTRVNATDVKFGYLNLTAGDYEPKFKYIALELPLAGTPDIPIVPGGHRIAVAKAGFDALTDTNPNNFSYDSRFGSMKYFLQGTTVITIPSDTNAPNDSVVFEGTVYTHNLGYYPLHLPSLEYSVDDPGKAYIMPVSFADAGSWTYLNCYVTPTELIFRAERGDIFGTTWPDQEVTIYWKIYSKDLGF